MTSSFQSASIRWDFNALALLDQLRPLEQEQAISAVARLEQSWRSNELPSDMQSLGPGLGGALYLFDAGSSPLLLIREDDGGRAIIDVVRPEQLQQLRQMNKKIAVNE